MNQAIEEIKWNSDGLVPAIAQDYRSGHVLMLAWMNRESLKLTIETGHAVYWSRSRNKLWHKGEESGHQQDIKTIKTDCDNDVILLKVKQIGDITCHTGRKRCFYKQYKDGKWEKFLKPIKSQTNIYRQGKKSNRDKNYTENALNIAKTRGRLK